MEKERRVTEILGGKIGGHIVAPFECDLRIFLKLRGRYPYDTIGEDKFLLRAIRRVNLDTFWSRERYTIKII